MSNPEENEQGEYEGGEHQPWREERNQPEPAAVEGHHAGRHVAEEKQRDTMDDTGVGRESTTDGGGGGGRHGDPEGLAGGTNYGTSGAHQGSTGVSYGRSSTRHSTGHGRSTEGAFGEETGQSNANHLNDIRDAGISRNEVGPSPNDDRTKGGDW